MSNTPTDCEEAMSCTASMQFAERVEPIGPDIFKLESVELFFFEKEKQANEKKKN